MIGWRLRWKTGCPGGPAALIDGTALRPEALATLSAAEVAATRIRVGSEAATLGELFEIQTLPGEVGMPRIRVDGSARFLHLGRGMEAGALEVEGEAGNLAGAVMRGGTLRVHGNVGNLAGAGMQGGLLHVDGDAGQQLGGPLPGGLRGLSGGEIFVEGTAGDDAGLRQEAGLLVIGGGSGMHPGRLMKGGTLLVLHGPLHLPGLEMRGGSILGPDSTQRPPTGFVSNGPVRLVWLRILKRRLDEVGLPLPEDAQPFLETREPLHSWSGDPLNEGKGEVLVRGG